MGIASLKTPMMVKGMPLTLMVLPTAEGLDHVSNLLVGDGVLVVEEAAGGNYEIAYNFVLR